MDFEFNNHTELINFALSQKRFKEFGKSYDLHHILPIHMGGKNDENNLVYLTRFEHILAHYFLALENKDYYRTNIMSANYLIYGKKSKLQENQIKELLKKPNIKEILENIRLLNLEVRKNPENEYWARKNNALPFRMSIQKFNNLNNKYIKIGKQCPVCGNKNSRNSFACCKEHEEQYIKPLKERQLERKKTCAIVKKIWYQLGSQKPHKCSSKTLQKHNYTQIKDCPICHLPNSENSFACNKEHENQYLSLLNNKKHELRSKQIQDSWKNDNTRSLRIEKLKKNKPHIKIGQGKGLYIHKDDIVKRVKENELQQYLDSGWIKGSIDRRKNIGGPHLNRTKTEWINKDGKNKMCSKEDLDLYIKEGWALGRPKMSDEQRKKLTGKRGYFWITNGIISKITKDENIPVGFYKGRVQKI